jgi:hypothetical protein
LRVPHLLPVDFSCAGVVSLDGHDGTAVETSSD